MPYFYVDGLRDGQPAQALYIQADDADAAKVRAAQLHMDPTGVRPARAMPNTSQPRIWPLYVFPFLLMLMCLLGIVQEARLSVRPPSTALMVMISTISPMIFCIIHHLTRMHERQLELQAEINDMRAQLMSRNLLNGRCS